MVAFQSKKNQSKDMKVLVFTEKPFAPAAVKAIEDVINASGNELEVVER